MSVIYYFLPEDRSTAVRIGCRFVSVLIEAGLPAVAATSSGRAPQWFADAVPVISGAEAAERTRRYDWVVCGARSDKEFETGAMNRVLHCVSGEDNPRAERHASWTEIWSSTPWCGDTSDSGVAVRDVGAHLQRDFFYDGTEIDPNGICVKGQGDEIEKHKRNGPDWLQWVTLDSADEGATALQLKRASFFLSLGGHGAAYEALEAMAAGCIVLSQNAGSDNGIFRPGRNCVDLAGSELDLALAQLEGPTRRSSRQCLRHAAIATAARYTRRAHVRWLRETLTTVTSRVSS